MAEHKDFYSRLAELAKESGDSLVGSIIMNAKQGDASSLKILERALMDSKYDVEESIKITDKQFNSIIKLAAERLNG